MADHKIDEHVAKEDHAGGEKTAHIKGSGHGGHDDGVVTKADGGAGAAASHVNIG